MSNIAALFIYVLVTLISPPPDRRSPGHEAPPTELRDTGSMGFDQYHIIVDKYNDLPPKAEIKRLDDFAVALKSHPDSVAYILAYGSRRSCFGEAKARADRAKHYLLRWHNIAADRAVAMDGGYNQELTVELWIGVKGGPPLSALPTVDEKEVQLVGDCRVRGTLKPAPNNGMQRTRK